MARCKPGDLAVIMYTTLEKAHNLGKLVMVVKALGEETPKWGLHWVVEPQSSDVPPAAYYTAWDASLKPLRDPGDDARDETLDWLPVPERE